MQDSTGTRGKLREIYDILLNSFGPQGWWPVYSDGGPGYHPDDFSYPSTGRQRLEIAIGAILTQQTSWKNAEKALRNLMENGLIDLEGLKGIDGKRLENLVRCSGYYRQKAERLKVFSGKVLEKYGCLDRMLSLPQDELRGALLSIKGIGRETADSIMLYSAGKPIFVVDAYTFRAMERLGIHSERDYDALQSVFHRSIKRDERTYNEFHALLVRLGKEHCRRVPMCEGCPLRPLCKYDKKV